MLGPEFGGTGAPRPMPGVVQVAITGRITAAAMAAFCADLERALDAPGDFAVVFDRRRMSAPTPDGREALERMGEELMPRLAERCLAWADVYDERRAQSLNRTASRASDQDTDREPAVSLPYPHKVFADHAEAVSWAGRLDGAARNGVGGTGVGLD